MFRDSATRTTMDHTRGLQRRSAEQASRLRRPGTPRTLLHTRSDPIRLRRGGVPCEPAAGWRRVSPAAALWRLVFVTAAYSAAGIRDRRRMDGGRHLLRQSSCRNCRWWRGLSCRAEADGIPIRLSADHTQTSLVSRCGRATGATSCGDSGRRPHLKAVGGRARRGRSAASPAACGRPRQHAPASEAFPSLGADRPPCGTSLDSEQDRSELPMCEPVVEPPPAGSLQDWFVRWLATC
jgi:hypothetical protein